MMEVCQICGMMTECMWCADCQQVYCTIHFKHHACEGDERDTDEDDISE
jgi:hypothetical protein